MNYRVIVNHGMGVGDWLNKLSEIYFDVEKRGYKQIKLISNNDTIKYGYIEIANSYFNKLPCEVEYEYQNVNNIENDHEYLGPYWPVKKRYQGGNSVVVYACICNQLYMRSNITKCFTELEADLLYQKLDDEGIEYVCLEDLNPDHRNPYYRNKAKRLRSDEEFVEYIFNMLATCKCYIGSECFYTHLCKAMGVPFICLDKRTYNNNSKYYFSDLVNTKVYGRADVLISNINGEAVQVVSSTDCKSAV